MKSKKVIRKEVLLLRDKLDEKERYVSSRLLTKIVLNHQWYQNATDFLVYMSYGSEVITDNLIWKALKDGKNVYLPKIMEDKMHMKFFQFFPDEDLTPGYKGILEPKEGKEFLYTDTNKNQCFMLMPGVAFDDGLGRIGYGKGFYDRYLSDKTDMRRIAIAFSCQKVEHIEMDPYDIGPMEVYFA